MKEFLLEFKQPEHFFITGDPLIYGSYVAIVIVSLAIIIGLTYFKKWGWLWREWITTVDHKRIGILYLLAALAMLFRGGVDALLMRIQLALPNMDFLDAEHYNQIFTTHGTIMILFMAMPFIVGLMNIAVPLQIGARDVAFPALNAVSFWMFAAGAFLFNISFVLGGSPEAGWTSYTPLAGEQLDPGPGQNYYLLGVQIAGIGTLVTGINFIVTIIKMRAPGMTLWRMPLFTWSTLITSVIIIFAFPVLTVALAMMTLDRIFDFHFFTMTGGGSPMMWANLFWIWGHPEVYIVILPAFGLFSEAISTFARKKLFGYNAMVYSMIAISGLSFLVWVHHFFTMGSGPWVNSIFSISTMLIAIPTGVKVFNWLFTLRKGRITFETPMLWALAFIPTFLIGGITGVMLAVAPTDYQYHNSYFLISHFHYTLIGGTVFGCIVGLVYYWPKMFGVMMNEKIGKWAFWLFQIGFHMCFIPMYIIGLKGMTRRMYTYPAELGWGSWNMVMTIGAFLMGIGFIVLVWCMIDSFRNGKRDTTGDPWNARTLEWMTASPAAEYNFATIPTVTGRDAFHLIKKAGEKHEPTKLKPIHMPMAEGFPFVMAVFMFIAGFGFVFEWLQIATLGVIGVLATMLWRSFNDYDRDYYIPVDTIERTERAWKEGIR
jgi:cytochrome aa3-600 menaquinol oxidase subunit 1